MEFKEISPSTLAEEVLRLIVKEGEYGAQLPTQRDLAEQLNISRNSVKYALTRLQQEGEVQSENRKGININKKIDVNLLGMESLSSVLGINNESIQHISTNIVSMSKGLSSFFGHDSTKLIEIKRIRFYKNNPFSFEISYLDYHKYKKLADVDFNDYYLYESLKNIYHTMPSYGYENIACTLADDVLAKILNVGRKQPLYEVGSFNYGNNDDPIEHSIQYLPGNNFKYHFRARNIFDYQEDDTDDLI
ncbi:GntR family transcriptional regulator [Lapidilactobacillus dextrinicus]|uniref:GntR family transcriptional regulator n=1 Tax=Lapidilactobacillus dextrinicus TaxID=51664 RepID=UPI0022E4C23E|nr:GntR family transcriptional regulator [Lapidilactobacillus dextrinicus]